MLVAMTERRPAMPDTYLTTSYRDREQVKALGARWDALQRRWYVPEGADLARFASWLPPAAAQPASEALSLAEPGPGQALAPSSAPGQTLSQLMAGVAQVVAGSFRQGVWVRVEVMRADLRRGHVYLELAERDARGDTLAQARAMIWSAVAQQIVPAFERATGVVLGAGIKLLVRARPGVHALYGLSLAIDAIDPDYTLGDLEAKKREIRERLQREGLFDANRRLAPPWDYQGLVVVTPEGAAGLGDFRAEADRLQAAGLCRFAYATSRFQGEGAAAELRLALLQALDRWRRKAGGEPDALVIVRGGGAVNDLAWLNDYALARCLCECSVPVLTGIGHERDRTLLDEVAQQAFDTPSKVIAAVEQLIVRRAREAKALHVELVHACAARLEGARSAAAAGLVEVQSGARRQLTGAQTAVPLLWSRVQSAAGGQLQRARDLCAFQREAIGGRAAAQIAQARQAVAGRQSGLAVAARAQLAVARESATALMREVAGQGPAKTLARGFAMVAGADGRTLTSARSARRASRLDIRFHDGGVSCTPGPDPMPAEPARPPEPEQVP